ncbi:MAG: DNA modification methylase [Pseudohongiellaceae bacterium]
MTAQLPDQIQHWPLKKLKPYQANARTHSAEQVAQIAASMAEFGWTNPVLAESDGTIIAGHGRLEAARQAGFKQVPVIVLDGLSPEQAKALRIADNKLALNAGWDEATLTAELSALLEDGYDLGLTGFDDSELKALFGGDDAAVEGEDELPELPDEPVSKLGDLWELGEHRLLCGDATDPKAVKRLLGKEKPHLMVCDPPYGVDYDPAWRNEAGASETKRTGRVKNDDRADWREAWALFPGDVAYVWHAGVYGAVVAESLIATGFNIRAQIIWSKPRLVLSRGDYHWKHEPCIYAVKKGKKSHWQGARDQSTIWEIAPITQGEDEATEHGTQKPVETMRRPIVNNSATGEAVYEPFAGSGSTLIAAETVGRRCLAMELDPRYCDLIVARWEGLTGGKAELLA